MIKAITITAVNATALYTILRSMTAVVEDKSSVSHIVYNGMKKEGIQREQE